MNIYFYRLILMMTLTISQSEAIDFEQEDLNKICIASEEFFQPIQRDLIEKKKYNLSICAILTYFPKNLNDWIDYHRSIGVDHFYFYNNSGQPFDNALLDSYISKEIVTLIDWSMPILKEGGRNNVNWTLGTQVPAYENALKIKGKKETKWLVFMDVNEYLVVVAAANLTELLNLYDDKAAITLSSYTFESPEKRPKKKFLTESLKRNAKTVEVIPPKESHKTIFKTDETEGFTWPPYRCILKNGQSDFKIETDPNLSQ